MGEAARKRRAHHNTLMNYPICVYCGDAAGTIEHMPPTMMFRRKDRPKGLEFPSCRECNNGTSHADLLASALGRAYPPEEEDERDFRKLLQAIANNIPDALLEMQEPRIRQRQTLRQVGMPLDHGVLRVDGPVVSRHMITFAAKVGFALHFEAFQARVPEEGGVYPMWMSNVQALRGEMPEQLLQFLPAQRATLRQGKKHVSDQFTYTWAITEERKNGLFYAAFRQAFAVAAITALDRSFFHRVDPTFTPLFRPGDLRINGRNESREETAATSSQQVHAGVHTLREQKQ